METFSKSSVNLNYFFRNRIAQLYPIMKEKNIEGLLLLTSYDCKNSKYMHQFFKWLLLGCSSVIEIEEKSIPPEFNETIILITLKQIFIFSLNPTLDFFNEICSKVNNVELFISSKKEEENSDCLQILKISKFIEWTKQVKRIGIPLNHEQSQNKIKLEQWPLIGATGFDNLKLGFFTMNHDIIDIRKDLEFLYHRIDLDACQNFINPKVNLLESIITDFYMYFEREPINKRLERSEENMNENQNLELIRLNYNSLKKTTFEYLNDLPDPRVLYGTNSNNNFNSGCSTEALYKRTFDYKVPAFHMTYENMDPITGIRLGRTLFLYNLQQNYLDFNEQTFKYDFIPSLIYPEAFYLFNLYFILVSFYRNMQFNIILNKLPIDKAKEALGQLLNKYIMTVYSKEYFDYLINENNIIINIREYILEGRALEKEINSIYSENKIIILRIELKEILSAVSHRRIGSLLFCDSFLYCYSELFNLTSDILPFKFLMISTRHFKLEEYNHNQILKSVSQIKLQDIEYRGLSFYTDDYTVPYIFPDSKELGLDHNQMFIFFTGKINVFDDYLVFNDSAIGAMIVSLNNIKQVSFLEELKYTVIIFEFYDMKCLPLSGILKNEFVLYFRGNTERLRGYARNIIEFLQGCKMLKGKINVMSNDKYFEYEIVIKTINENEYDNLSYISNSYNLTNINDVLIEMLEYEYLKYTHTQYGKMGSFMKYKTIKTEGVQLIEKEKGKIAKGKKKLMFIFGQNPKNVINIKDKIVDFANKSGYKSNVIIPAFSLFNFKSNFNFKDKEINSFYVNSIKKIDKTTTINLLCFYHSCNIIQTLYNIIKSFKSFYDEYEILNVSYTVNYSNYKGSRHKDIINRDFYYEDIVNFIFIDEGMLKQEKISKYNKLITLSNSKSTIFNHRSFFLNTKEMKKIFTLKLINEVILNFYFEYYRPIESIQPVYQNCFIPFTYMCKEEIIKDFVKRAIGYPLQNLFTDNNKYPALNKEIDYYKIKYGTDDDYLNGLVNISKIDRARANEPYFIEMFGNVVYLNESNLNTNNREIVSFSANYKESQFEILKNVLYAKEKKEIGIFALGKNLVNNKDIYDFYLRMEKTFAGELPVKREYGTKEGITKEERENLNFANMNRPLPLGWELQAPVFVDPDDNIHEEHPDIELFIDEYIMMSKIAIDEHNQKIQSEIDSYKI